MSSDDSCPRSFARSNRYCMAIVEKGYQLGVVQPVGNGAARVVHATHAVQIVLHLLARLAEVLAVAVGMEAFHVLELGPGRGVEVCGGGEDGGWVRRESEQSRQMSGSGFLSVASLRSCFLDLEEGASEGSWWLEDSSAGKETEEGYGICDYLWNDGFCRLSTTPFLEVCFVSQMLFYRHKRAI